MDTPKEDRTNTPCGRVLSVFLIQSEQLTNKQTLWRLVLKRAIPTERPPLVGEI
jgi:hypothetical protein